MSSLNKVMLMGNLTRTPILRATKDGTNVADLGLAVSEHFKDKKGDKAQSTCFVDIVAWGPQAEACGKYLEKGSPVLVEGKLQLDRWSTETGEPRSKLRVRAQLVQFLGQPPSRDESETADETEHALA